MWVRIPPPARHHPHTVLGGTGPPTRWVGGSDPHDRPGAGDATIDEHLPRRRTLRGGAARIIWPIGAILLATVVVVTLGWVAASWHSTNQVMTSLREHPALHADLDAVVVSRYERRPSVVEAVPLVRETWASNAAPEELTDRVERAFSDRDVQMESPRSNTRGEVRRWRHWPGPGCPRTSVTARVTPDDPRHDGDRGVDEQLNAAPGQTHSWLQITVHGCG